MALILRSIVEVVDADFVSAAERLFGTWLQWKVARTVDVAGGALTGLDRTGHEVDYEFRSCTARDRDGSVFRGHLFEKRADEEVRTTFTALAGNDTSWSWTDLERLTTHVFAPGWIPFVPRIVRSVLTETRAMFGNTPMRADYEICGRDGAEALSTQLLDPERAVAVVIASPTRAEREGDMDPCRTRAKELQQRLAGIARVVALEPGATSALSKALVDQLGEDWDVHSGAVRTYLPGLGRDGDSRRRHRVIPFHRLEGRPAETAGRLISLPLIQASCLHAPPALWSDHGRHLPEFAEGGGADTDTNAILELAETERAAALERASEAEARRADERETVDEVLAQLDELTRRIGYLEGELETANASALHAQPHVDVFEPEWCEEVAREADRALQSVVIGGNVIEAAGELDVHDANASWARKAWRSLQALQAYVEAKQAGDTPAGDFKHFCEQSGNPAAIPSSWIAMHESQTTKRSRRFRSLRTLPVADAVDPSGTVYMEAHIKLEKGGTPCPRIHFYDDTEGPTSAVHVGWFGDHLDSTSQS